MDMQEYIDDYSVHSLLGDGGQAKYTNILFRVYLCSREDRLCAIKVYDAGVTKRESFKKEVEFLSKLNCPNLINMLDSKIDGRVRVGGKEECLKPIVVLEYAECGELYDFISNKGGFQPSICRTIIKGLINAIEYMHLEGVTHRDLKLENILFDQNFKLKVSDFGLSTFIDGHDGDGILRSKVGTEGYRPPEMEKGKYTGIQSDIFAIGVTLFMLYTGSPPFLSTKTADKVYRRIKDGRYESFWSLHEKKRQQGFYSDSFKRLMNSFFHPDPEQRPTFESLREDEWLNGTEATEQELKEELQIRRLIILEEDDNKRKINQITFKFRQQQIKKEKQEVISDCRGTEQVEFMEYHKKFIQEIDESAIKKSSVQIATSEESPAFLVAWLKSYLKQSEREGETFLPGASMEIKPEEFTLGYDQTEMKIKVNLVFEVEEEDYEELKIMGKLVKNKEEKIGVSWAQDLAGQNCEQESSSQTYDGVKGEQGNSFWIRSVILALNLQIKSLKN